MSASAGAPPSVTEFPMGRNAGHPTQMAGIPTTEARGGAAHTLSHDERAAAGKALRDKSPRTQHAIWKKSEARPDPIEILHAGDTDRLQELVPIRYGRMLQSPFTFYRGSAAVMAADLAHTPTTGIKVQACGDCHLMNFGGFATPERNIIFDINDFDETLPAPWEWDVKRLAASIVLAARSIGLSDAKARDCAIACARSYRKRLSDFARNGSARGLVPAGHRRGLIGIAAEGAQKVSSRPH